MSKVHVACFDDNHIVPRMMQWLSDSLGWSIGPYLQTGGGVEINYYAPYTMYGRFGPGGKSMAWFTHKESASPAKLEIWKNAGKHITMPLVTSKLYQNELNATLITPGIDQSHFKLSRKRFPKKGIVGIVGTYQPRKGPNLALDVLNADGVNDVRIVGDDWPGIFNSRKIAYKDMPKFYRDLDLFVCTSTEEGIPAPPLEALACGVPVLVPIGVGMLDDLPHAPGIYRYTSGDADEMKAQIELILDGANHKRAELRDYVAPYTKQAWVDSHKLAMENLLS